MTRLLPFIFALILSPTLATAQQPAPAKAPTPGAPAGADGVVYKKVTEMNFEADDVEGSFVRPGGEYLDARRRAKYSSLIKVRKNFIPEMLKSAEDI